ncbi:DUF4236 domain-containing protein [Ruminococcus sp.]|uniref:DUF4236 domain-containing protein n=1 Tax=Ruminococcus sp. TaxID=41978 RepID=UPI003AB88446
MGLRFRKSIKLGKHTRLNLNKKSFGVSFGGKGARFTLNSKGRRTSTFGIPGTGLSYTTASGGKKKSRSKSKAKGRKVCGSSTGAAKPSGCLIVAACIGIIFIMICLVMAVVIGKNKNGNGSSITLEWTQSDISVNSKAYIPNLYLKVDGKKANEISPPEIQISNNDICKIEYKDSNYAQVIYEIIPLKDGFADITATYDGVTSEPVTITVDMGEKVETTTATTTETETKPPETTTETTTTAKQQEIVYITPTGDKYHTKSCRYYSDSCMAMTKEQAIQAGYTACDVCH